MEIYQFYWQGASVVELAKQYGFTVQYIRRILKRLKATK